MSAAMPSPADRIRRSGFDLPSIAEVAEKAGTLARYVDRGALDRADAFCVGALVESVAMAIEAWERCDDENVGRILRQAASIVLAREAAGL